MEFATFKPIVKEINEDFNPVDNLDIDYISKYIQGDVSIPIDIPDTQFTTTDSNTFEKESFKIAPVVNNSINNNLENSTSTISTPQSKKEFLETYKPIVDKFAKDSGLNSDLLIAQIALETGWGKSVPGFNVGGLKYIGKGDSQTLKTTEFINGNRQNLYQKFQKFNSLEDGVKAYINTLSGRRYGALRGVSNPYEGAKILQKSGYATDPNYANKLQNILNTIYSI